MAYRLTNGATVLGPRPLISFCPLVQRGRTCRRFAYGIEGSTWSIHRFVRCSLCCAYITPARAFRHESLVDQTSWRLAGRRRSLVRSFRITPPACMQCLGRARAPQVDIGMAIGCMGSMPRERERERERESITNVRRIYIHTHVRAAPSLHAS